MQEFLDNESRGPFCMVRALFRMSVFRCLQAELIILGPPTFVFHPRARRFPQASAPFDPRFEGQHDESSFVTSCHVII